MGLVLGVLLALRLIERHLAGALGLPLAAVLMMRLGVGHELFLVRSRRSDGVLLDQPLHGARLAPRRIVLEVGCELVRGEFGRGRVVPVIVGHWSSRVTAIL